MIWWYIAKAISQDRKLLKDLFRRHALGSCQVTNTAKSTIFSTSISHNRLGQIFNLLDFKIGYLPFIYFGVPIFKGKPKVNHLQPITDKIKLKLSNWKASLLAMVGRVQLVRFMIQSMLTYSIKEEFKVILDNFIGLLGNGNTSTSGMMLSVASLYLKPSIFLMLSLRCYHILWMNISLTVTSEFPLNFLKCFLLYLKLCNKSSSL